MVLGVVDVSAPVGKFKIASVVAGVPRSSLVAVWDHRKLLTYGVRWPLPRDVAEVS